MSQPKATSAPAAQKLDAIWTALQLCVFKQKNRQPGVCVSAND
jgi:hypothetical protein